MIDILPVYQLQPGDWLPWYGDTVAHIEDRHTGVYMLHLKMTGAHPAASGTLMEVHRPDAEPDAEPELLFKAREVPGLDEDGRL